jgi:hypothetical protein
MEQAGDVADFVDGDFAQSLAEFGLVGSTGTEAEGGDDAGAAIDFSEAEYAPIEVFAFGGGDVFFGNADDDWVYGVCRFLEVVERRYKKAPSIERTFSPQILRMRMPGPLA